MKGQGKWKNTKRKTDNGKLQKYRVSVDDFVQSNGGCDEVENDRGLRFVKKKSRKELRKEKRNLKKAKMKSHYEGKKNLDLLLGDGENSAISADKPQLQRKKVKDKAKKEMPEIKQSKAPAAPEKSGNSKTQSASKKGKKTTKLQETRKMALLEANEAEDREIKKLERYLGLNKRKNKKTLPQSFAADGLDYILGVLDPGSSAVGGYDSDDDMDMAKEKFERLDKSDSQMSGEEEESGDEFADESGDEDLDSTDNENEDEEDDDEMVDEEEDGMEEDEDELDGSDVADSGDESEGEAETQTDAANTNSSGSKTETVSS